MVLYTNSLCIENISINVARNNMSVNRLYVTGEIQKVQKGIPTELENSQILKTLRL